MQVCFYDEFDECVLGDKNDEMGVEFDKGGVDVLMVV